MDHEAIQSSVEEKWESALANRSLLHDPKKE